MGRCVVALLVTVVLCGGVLAQDKEAPTWKTDVEFGLSGARGNTHSNDMRAAVTSKKETEQNRVKLDLCYNLSSTKGNNTRNDLTTGALHDWLFSGSPWFAFAEGRYDYDDFNTWRSRFSGRVGPGYDILLSEQLDMTARASIGAYEGLDDDKPTRFEAGIGGNLLWRVRKGMEVGVEGTYYPSITDTLGDPFRTIESAYCKLNLEAYKTMAVKLGISHEHQSEVRQGRRKNDVRFFVTAVMSF